MIFLTKILIVNANSFPARRLLENLIFFSESIWPRKVCRLLFATLAFCWLSAVPVSQSEGAAPLEYQVKAAFIYKFINFIEWPARAWRTTGNTIVIGVFGESPILEALNSLPSKKIQGRYIKIKHIKNLQDLKSCHIVFIGTVKKPSMKNILDHLKGACVLTISDTKEFARMGGMINFFLDKEKIRFEMNPDAAKEAELKISSKILRLAKIVRTQRAAEEN